MSGYPYHPPPGYSYGGPPPPHPCGSSGPPLPQQYGSSASQEQQQYGSSAPPQSQQYGSAPSYGSPPYGSSYGAPAGSNKPPKENPYAASAPGGGIGYPPSAPYGSSFTSLLPSTFPPGADPSIVACFQIADQDGSGFIDDKELQRALSSYNQSFSLRTVHLLMHHFTNTSTRTIGESLSSFASISPPQPYWFLVNLVWNCRINALQHQPNVHLRGNTVED
ncbi:Calcium-binding protein CBP [Linum perenne]